MKRKNEDFDNFPNTWDMNDEPITKKRSNVLSNASNNYPWLSILGLFFILLTALVYCVKNYNLF